MKVHARPKKNKCVFPVSRPTPFFPAKLPTLNFFSDFTGKICLLRLRFQHLQNQNGGDCSCNESVSDKSLKMQAHFREECNFVPEKP